MKEYSKILYTCLILILLFQLEACIEDENDLNSQNCNDRCATLNGIITTGEGLEPLKNAELEVIWKNTVYLGGGIIRTKAKTRTDETGYYELNFRVREDELEKAYFIVKIYINQNYLSCGNEVEYHDFAIAELQNDTVITTNYGIPYKATLKVNSTGASEMADNDYFSLTTTSPAGINFESGCGTVVNWTNETPNQEYSIDVAAEQPVIVRVGIRKGTQHFNKTDTLYIKKGEQLE